VNFRNSTKERLKKQAAPPYYTTAVLSVPAFAQIDFSRDLRIEKQLTKSGESGIFYGTVLDATLVKKFATSEVIKKNE